MFKVKREGKFQKEFEKLKKKDFFIHDKINKKLNELKLKPFPSNKNHILSVCGSEMLCEIAYNTIRVYYVITREEIVIEKIVYEGFVNVYDLKKNHKSGNSRNYPNQRKFINKEKKSLKNERNKNIEIFIV